MVSMLPVVLVVKVTKMTFSVVPLASHSIDDALKSAANNTVISIKLDVVLPSNLF